MYDVGKIRRDFPILFNEINGKKQVYLDTAASAQKPKCVIDKMSEAYQKEYANIHRGVYKLAEMVTTDYELARKKVQNFINAKDLREIVFTRNATESINLVAATWGIKNIKSGDEILISEAEHHANLVPWQMLCQKTGATLKIFKVADDGSFLKDEFEKTLSDKIKLVAVTGMSNVLGTVFPIKEIINKAHSVNAKVLIDACQYVVHEKIDVADLDCDFLVFSSHKLYGPTGIGVLFAKVDILYQMPPYQTGGDMVDTVTFEKATFAEPPARFEAGTPAIIEAIGLSEALAYVENLGMENIKNHEKNLILYMYQKAVDFPDLKFIGTAENKGGVFAFDFAGIHPQDLAFILAKEGVSIRIGHHCAEPLVHRMGYNSLARASFGLYTSKEDIDTFFEALRKAKKFF